MIVGGEFVFSPSIFFNKDYHQFSDYGSSLTKYYRYYTFGAYYSIKLIIRNIRILPNEYVLLPSYLCPTIIEPFRKLNVKYEFYKISEGLIPNFEDIHLKMRSNLRAILFIDYYGFPYGKILKPLIEYMRSKSIIVIQDTVQSWLNNENELFGDFCFNSVRKYSPIEASVLLSTRTLLYNIDGKSITQFIIHKRLAQILRYIHIKSSLMTPKIYLKHIAIANNKYHQEGVIGLPKLNKWLLDRINFQILGEERRIVYEKLITMMRLKIIVKQDIKESIVPLGLPIYLEDRDRKKTNLHLLDIHCPVHWMLSEEIDKKEYEISWEISQNTLTIPITIRTDKIDEYVKRLVEVI